MGNPQVAERHNKPAAGFAEDKLRFQSPEDIVELAEQFKSIEKKRQRDGARATKVSEFLGDNMYRIDKTWPFLYSPVFRMQLSVRFYFPRKNLAIDQFRSPTKQDFAAIEFKKKMFKEHKIKYFPMLPQTKLMELADYL